MHRAPSQGRWAQRVDHLGRDVHEHTDETERPDSGRNLDIQFRFGERRFNGHCSLRQKRFRCVDLAMKPFTRPYPIAQNIAGFHALPSGKSRL